jgi:recombination protein RecA
MVKKKKETLENTGTLQETINEIKQKFGDDSIATLNEKKTVDVDVIPTGALSLDIALGAGGMPRGRIIEIFGPESSGKTTLSLHVIAESQKKGGVAAFIDAEHALDPEYAKRIGVKTKDLLISQPNSGEEALDIVETLVRSGNVDVIVIDSVAALTPRAEIEGEMGQQQMGLQARLMSKALRKLSGIVYKTDTVVIFLNQIRMKIGVMFGNPETTTGGLALKFFSSVRLDLRRIAKIQDKDNIIGGRHRVKVVKNKVGAPFTTTELDIYYNEGISKLSDLITMGVKYEIVKKSGSWFQYKEDKLGQGLEQSKNYLKENPKVANSISSEIKKLLSSEGKDS